MPTVASETSAFPTTAARGNTNRSNARDGAEPFSAALDEAAANTSANAERPAEPGPRAKPVKSDRSERADRPAKAADSKRSRNAERADKPANNDNAKALSKADKADKAETAADAQTDNDTDATADAAVAAQTDKTTTTQTVEADAVAAMAATVAAIQCDAPAANADADATQPMPLDGAATTVAKVATPDVAANITTNADAPKAVATPAGEAAKPVEDATAKQAAVAALAEPLLDKAAPKTSVPQVPRALIHEHKSEAKVQPLLHDAPQVAADDADAAAPATAEANAVTPRLSELAAMAREGARGERFELTRATADATAPAPQANTPAVNPAANHAVQAAAQAIAQTPAAQAQNISQAVPLNGVGVEIAAQALGGKHRFEIRMDPPELGRIEVRLDVDAKGHVVSHITADRGDTLDLLRRDSANLERALQDAGLKTSDQGLQFSLRDQGGNQREPLARDAAAITVSDELTASLELSQRGYRRNAGLSGGIDIRV